MSVIKIVHVSPEVYAAGLPCKWAPVDPAVQCRDEDHTPDWAALCRLDDGDYHLLCDQCATSRLFTVEHGAATIEVAA